MSSLSRPFKLKNGTEVLIRAIRPEDEASMVRFHAALSDRTVYLRYFASLSLAARTAHERLVRICFVDPESERVLVATHADLHNNEEIVAVGRLNKLLPKNEAEVAILVSDEFQGRGMGSQLLEQLIQIARDQKLECVTAEVLRDNIVMQAIFKKHGFQMCSLDDPGSVKVRLEL